MFDSLVADCEEIIYILTKIIQTSRSNIINKS